MLVLVVGLVWGVSAAWASPQRPATTDVIVVLDEAFRPGGHAANQARAVEIAEEHGLQARFTYGTALFGFAASVPHERLAGLERDRRVAYLDLDREMHALAPKWCDPDSTHPACADDGDDGSGGDGTTTDTLPWGVDRIDADLNSGTGLGTHAYVIDTGIDSDHPDLQANLGNGYAVEPCKGSGSVCKHSWDDDHGHGTHVAGTVGAAENGLDVIGVAPGVTLHAVKVLAKSGSGSRSGVIAGVDWVANEVSQRGQAAVANMSLGGSGSKTGTCTQDAFTGSDSYHQALCEAARAGVVTAVAAGNDGADAENAVPAAYDDAVVTVTATDSKDAWASWSNWGDGAAGVAAPAPVTIAAPGVSVLSTALGGGTTTKSGTSMAAPHAAGALALYLAAGTQSPDYSAFANAQQALLAAAEPTGSFTATKDGKHTEPFLDAQNL